MIFVEIKVYRSVLGKLNFSRCCWCKISWEVLKHLFIKQCISRYVFNSVSVYVLFEFVY